MAQVLFYRYVDDAEATIIQRDKRIEPVQGQTCKWYTPDRYDSGADAQKYLALQYAPTHRVGPIPSDEMPDFDHTPLRVVGADRGQPGGRLEAATSKALYLFDIAGIP